MGRGCRYQLCQAGEMLCIKFGLQIRFVQGSPDTHGHHSFAGLLLLNFVSGLGQSWVLMWPCMSWNWLVSSNGF